jgi:hypothetical protein
MQEAMKKIRGLFLFISVLVVTIIISCSKEDVASNDSTQTSKTNVVVEYYSVNPPYDEGEPGKEPTNPWEPPIVSDSASMDPQYPYTVIEIPTKAYKDETCLLDLSKLEVHKTYHSIQNDDLTVSFGSESVLKLNSGPTGWNSHWGSAPNVECENPDVLYSTIYFNIMVIYLSKPCVEFGFELAPNHQNYDHNFGAIFGNDFLDYSEGFTSSVIRSPSGARLFAIKASHPFTQITIKSNDSPTGDISANGIAFANIRYKLAK